MYLSFPTRRRLPKAILLALNPLSVFELQISYKKRLKLGRVCYMHVCELAGVRFSMVCMRLALPGTDI